MDYQFSLVITQDCLQCYWSRTSHMCTWAVFRKQQHIQANLNWWIQRGGLPITNPSNKWPKTSIEVLYSILPKFQEVYIYIIIYIICIWYITFFFFFWKNRLNISRYKHYQGIWSQQMSLTTLSLPQTNMFSSNDCRPFWNLHLLKLSERSWQWCRITMVPWDWTSRIKKQLLVNVLLNCIEHKFYKSLKVKMFGTFYFCGGWKNTFFQFPFKIHSLFHTLSISFYVI